MEYWNKFSKYFAMSVLTALVFAAIFAVIALVFDILLSSYLDHGVIGILSIIVSAILFAAFVNGVHEL